MRLNGPHVGLNPHRVPIDVAPAPPDVHRLAGSYTPRKPGLIDHLTFTQRRIISCRPDVHALSRNHFDLDPYGPPAIVQPVSEITRA
jgi:hypothetical protein